MSIVRSSSGTWSEIIPDALDMLHKEMKKAPNKDRVKAGIDFSTRARVFEDSRTPPQPVPALQNVDSDEQDRREVKKIIEAFAEIAIETHRVFGLEMPVVELVRQKLNAGWRSNGNENS